MKANKLSCKDLMVGDWVYNTHNRQNGRVQEIGSGLVMLDYNDLYEYDEIEPIPLTPEILEKNGFVKGYMFNNVWNYIEDYKRLVIVYTGEVFNIQDTLIEFKHVHELQHILKICGIEKEIIL